MERIIRGTWGGKRQGAGRKPGTMTKLDARIMDQASEALTGEHSTNSYRATLVRIMALLEEHHDRA